MSDANELSASDRHGGYRPHRVPGAGHPLFQWPPRPKAILNFLFGFPGYLWPWQIFFIGFALVSWLYLTPDAATTEQFSIDWITLLFVRNVVALTLFLSIWHVWLYIRRAQGTRFKYNPDWLAEGNPAFLFRSQLWDNVFWNLCSAVPIWTAYEVITLWLFSNGFLTVLDWREHPTYFVLLLLLQPMWMDVHFYFTHRAIHWRPLYRRVHSLHHKNVNVGPWSGLAMHPAEHLLYFSGVLLFWLIPSHPVHSIRLLHQLALGASLAHHGFDRLMLGSKLSFAADHYTHYLHHKHVQCNYGVDLVPLDRWLGTFHDGSETSTEKLKSRMRARALRSRAKAQATP